MRFRLHRLLWPALLLGGAVAACGGEVEPGVAEVPREEVSGVTVAEIDPTVVDETVEVSGTVRAAVISVVSSKAMGRVTSVRVSEGDHVTAGQLLLTIDAGDVRERVEAARAQQQAAQRALASARAEQRLAQSTYRRYRRLFEQGAIAEQQLDETATRRQVAAEGLRQARAAAEAAAAAVREARVQLQFTRVTAPITGVVSQKRVDLGSMANPGQPLMTIEDRSAYLLEVKLQEGLSELVTTGTPVMVHIGALDRQLEAEITEVVPSVNPASRSFVAKIQLAGPELRHGMYARVLVPVGEREALMVPREAVVEKGQLTGVYVVDDYGIVTYRLVRLGRLADGEVEIATGLYPGEEVIVGGVENARDGAVLQGR